MFSQQRILTAIFAVYFAAGLCILWLPSISAKYMENSKNELRENANSDNGKINTQFNAASASAYYTTKHNLRSMLMSPKDSQQKLRAKLPLHIDLMDFLLEYEDEDRPKRFDDYGHMRFGKRGGEEQFDDYGHMRFGRSI